MAWLDRLLRNSAYGCFVSGHEFTRADKTFVCVDPSRLQPTAQQSQDEFSSSLFRRTIISCYILRARGTSDRPALANCALFDMA